MLESFALSIVDGSLNRWIVETYWLWPVLEIVHFVGLSLLLGGLIIIDLRLAGLFRSLRPTATHKLVPLVLIGFGLNLVTGILFFYGDPLRYSVNIGFQIKMVLVVLAGLNTLFYYRKIKPVMHSWGTNADTPPVAKIVAITSLSAWGGVLLFGRLIPYVGTG
ncbi:MAG TPA: hypothetical protein QGF41_13360 [Gammaproteobacteria bacterium]|jgi:hypothetical protein|nr:hypothetical protein [Gammaproteobacteria bacterium]|tara:strand:+ start:9448 stop:9936 length:489 start_codon:yes stop_codon:yes gene_type:complete